MCMRIQMKLYFLLLYAISSFDIYRRPFEPNKDCLGSDLLWSDPVLKKGTSESIRGIGTFFGPDVTQEFLGRNSFKVKLSLNCVDLSPSFPESNDLMCVIRSHMEIAEGCGLNHPGCYTVFSAPNRVKGLLVCCMAMRL